MKAIISITGKDSMGIVAKTSTECLKYLVNIQDITQNVLDGFFTMIMLVDTSKITIDFNHFVDKMSKLGDENNLKIFTMHEDIFNAMHKI